MHLWWKDLSGMNLGLRDLGRMELNRRNWGWIDWRKNKIFRRDRWGWIVEEVLCWLCR